MSCTSVGSLQQISQDARQICRYFRIYLLLLQVLMAARVTIMDWRKHFMHVYDRDHWSWADLARKTGIDASQIQRWATGNTEPALGTAIQIAAAMDVGLNELFLGHLPESRIVGLVRQSLALMQEEIHTGLAETSSGNSKGA